MLQAVVLPSFGTDTVVVTVTAVHAARGDRLPADTPLADFKVEFDAGGSYQCPPVSHFRLLTRDAGWLLGLFIAVGDEVTPGAVLAELGAAQADPPRDAQAPPARVTLAGILPPQPSWWDYPA